MLIASISVICCTSTSVLQSRACLEPEVETLVQIILVALALLLALGAAAVNFVPVLEDGEESGRRQAVFFGEFRFGLRRRFVQERFYDFGLVSERVGSPLQRRVWRCYRHSWLLLLLELNRHAHKSESKWNSNWLTFVFKLVRSRAGKTAWGDLIK